MVRYSVHPGVVMTMKWIETLKEKTGHSLDEWMTLIAKDAPSDPRKRVEWLKKKHGLGTNSAIWLADRSMGVNKELGDGDDYLKIAPKYVDALYEGPKSALRQLHDALIDLALTLGKDIRISPTKTTVPIYRNHVIAQIKPSTRTRIDFGLALGDTKATGRLIDTGGFAKKDRITHRIAVASAADIGDELKRWLKRAYDLD